MSAKKNKYEYSLGGDVLGFGTDLAKTYANTFLMAPLGLKQFDVENKVLDKIDDVTTKVTPGLAAMGLNMVAPGLGGAYTAARTGVAGLTGSDDPDMEPIIRESFNAEPGYQRLATGGTIVNQMPAAKGTDTMPVDQVGNPTSVSKSQGIALVDSGEVIWNGYVFSKDLGFADKANKILSRYKMRLGEKFDGTDKLSKTQMDNELMDLADEQENKKEQLGVSDNSTGFAKGGGIEIDPEKKGTFTTAASRRGMGVQEFANHVLANKDKYSPVMQKKAQFAQNASKFKKAVYGDDLFGYDDPTKYNPYSGFMIPGVKPTTMPIVQPPKKVAPFKSQIGDFKYYDDWSEPIPMASNKMPTSIGTTPTSTMQPKQLISETMFKPIDPGTTNNELDWGSAIQAGTLAMRAVNATKKTKTPSSYGYIPSYVSMAESRNDMSREADIAKASSRRLFSDNRASQIAATTAMDSQLFKGLNDSYLREKSYNADARTRANQFGAQSRMTVDDMRARDEAAQMAAYDNILQDASGLVTGTTTDRKKMELEKMMMDILKDAYPYYTTSGEGASTRIGFRKGVKNG